MSTTQAMRLRGEARPFALRSVVEKYFYLFMSLIIALVVVYGFSLTIGQKLFHPTVKPPRLLWVHGTVFFAWLGIFILQSVLVRTRNVQIHKQLGWFFAGLGAIIPILGVTITRVMARFEITSLHANPLERLGFLAIPLQDMVAFTAAFTLAVVWRKRSEYHRRLMLIAACVLTAAAWGRMPTVENIPYLSFYSGVDALILLGVLRDVIVARRIHIVYLCFLPGLVPMQLGAIALATQGPGWWLRFGHVFIGI